MYLYPISYIARYQKISRLQSGVFPSKLNGLGIVMPKTYAIYNIIL